MYCPKCGALNNDSAVFCVKCGNQFDTRSAGMQPISSASDNNMPQTQTVQEQQVLQQSVQQGVSENNLQGHPVKKSGKKKMILAGSVIGALLLCVVVVLLVILRPFSDTDSEEGHKNEHSVSDKVSTSDKKKTESEKNPAHTDSKPELVQRGTSMSEGKDGALKIKRVQLGDDPMGDEGTYTVFVYMCGSDLESNKGYATKDLEEMINASTRNNVRFIIQTGGSAAWKNDVISAKELGRYEICGGKIQTLDSKPNASMGDTDTLSDFLKWGIEYAPAAKMGLIFWDHGGGSITGVCADRVKQGILTLTEIDAALAEVSGKMTDKFEFIGFDACLMATVECANILAPYADYMYASQENEPGSGWDYTAIGKYLDQNPKAKGDVLGKVVADSYYEQNKKPIVTFSVIDLSKTDQLVQSLNEYAKQLSAVSGDVKIFSKLVRTIHDADKFGSNNPKAGYTNMVDLAGVVNAGMGYVNGAQEVLNAIDSAVVYSIDGGTHADSCGLSTYYPLSLKQDDINIFADIAVCPYYMAFVFRTAYANEHKGEVSGYDESEVIDRWYAIRGEEKPSEEAQDYWDEYANTHVVESSSIFQFEIEPSYYDFTGDGAPEFGFLLTEESYYNLASVSTHAWKYLPEDNILLDLGIRDAGWNKDYWDNTVTCDATGGYHTQYLDDGQPLPQDKLIGNKYSNINFDTSVYITQVLLNGAPTYLLSGKNIGGDQTNSDGTSKNNGMLKADVIWGTWAGVSEDGTVDRSQVVQLKAGDIITPIYHAINLETGEEFDYYGEEYELSVPFVAGVFDCLKERGKLEDGKLEEYILYNFMLTDIYGNTYETCYRMYKRTTSITYNNGRPTGTSTHTEHMGMYKSIY